LTFGANIEISDSTRKKVLNAVADGHWFFANLPPGKYIVIVTMKGKEKQNRANIAKNQKQTIPHFYWN